MELQDQINAQKSHSIRSDYCPLVMPWCKSFWERKRRREGGEEIITMCCCLRERGWGPRGSRDNSDWHLAVQHIWEI